MSSARAQRRDFSEEINGKTYHAAFVAEGDELIVYWGERSKRASLSGRSSAAELIAKIVLAELVFEHAKRTP
jgi:hypothetical protein